MMSHSPACKNFVGRLTDAITVLPGRCHARHSRQVSHTGLIKASRASSTPAACRMWRILLSFACHHRRCSFRISFWITVGSYDRRLQRETWILNRVQSGSFGVPLLASTGLCRGCIFGPRGKEDADGSACRGLSCTSVGSSAGVS